MLFCSYLTSFLVLCASHLAGCAPEDPINPPLPKTPETVARGEQIVNGLAACGFCHSLQGKVDSPLAGGRLLAAEEGGVRGPNITLARSGLHGWKEGDVVRLFRAHTRPDGSRLGMSAHGGFEWLSDYDVGAIIAYLRSIPGLERTIEREGEGTTIGLNPFSSSKGSREVKGYVPAILAKYPAAYGQYLADHQARCGVCHNTPSTVLTSEDYWGGGAEISFDGETKVAPNITSSKEVGIGEWSPEDLRAFLTSGRNPRGEMIDTRFCPIEFFAKAPSSDLEALVTYIRSVPGIE